MLRRSQITLFFLLALTVLSGTVRAGTRYFFCSMMGARADACCVHHVDHPAEQAAIEPPAHACCEPRIVESLPASTLKIAAHVSPPALASSPLVFDFADLPASSVSSSRRARPHPPNFPQPRARLMVFLI